MSQGADGSFAYKNLAATFTADSLGVPPVPPALRDRLVRQDDWLYGTEPVSMLDLYLAEFPAIELVSKPSALAVGHGGQGFNSYAISYVLGFETIGLFAQVSWGGAYMDADKQAQEVTDRFDQIADLLARAPATEPGAARLLALSSSFRDRPSSFGWLEHDEPFTERWIQEHQVQEDPLVLALQAVS